ncbi:heparinase II/III family protein [Uliginosibacterium sp. 31-16]|uniref:heparinase II/III domain-containing protein n=1 Tax=Uliginosibacterium sp. 31-16 TaxID=3068315 RepID=UPI00273E7951|nr:heparinase II/III family protein [Uliginosibacterium sp. 31-16]MDP5239259.1 heparinase II/III family protein [Uliginosibacterium sp. 31-16]
MRIFLPVLLVILPALCWAQSDGELVAARAKQFQQQLADAHPRLLIRPADLPALREFIKTLPAQAEGATLAKLALPPLDNRALIPEPKAAKNGTPEGAKQWEAGYKAANETAAWAQRYALAWLLTEDPAYGREAARWLLHLASWNITRDTYRTNDELFIQSLRPMIFAYDWAYAALTPEERATVSKALIARMEILAAQVQPKFSLSRAAVPDNGLSHPMRFISTLGQGGLALFHETKEAPGWLAWSYEYYLRQFPVWGGSAGGWAEGLNYWNTGISQHQRFLEGMALLGFNEPLQKPFWRNTPYFGVYSQMPYPASFFGDLSNINAPSGSMALMMEKFAVLNADPYPLAYARALRQKPPTSFNYYSYDGIDAILQRFRTAQAKLPEVRLAELPQSRYFDDIGVVTMHSALGDAANDIMLGFRSSPQGSASHGFADQNSFVLNAFGQPLAINSGYREFYDSPHHVGWSRQTKSKSAILFGGEGQRIKDASASGAITRFADGASYSFATGDATRAYAPHATRALRHVFFVGRRYFVMLDEVAASEPVAFQWQLHARSEMQLAPERAEITLQQKDARLAVRFLQPAPAALVFRQTDAFEPPVIESYRTKMPNEWHVTAETKAAAPQQEFLTLLYPWKASPESGAAPASASMPAAKGHAMRLAGQGGEEVVLMAREAEKRAEAGGWALAGMAASFATQSDTLRFTLVEATGLSGPLSLKASMPVSLEGVRNANGLNIVASLREPLTLQLRPGFAVSSVTGAQGWQQDADGGVVVTLAAGPVRLSLLK